MTNTTTPSIPSGMGNVEQEQIRFARWFDSHVATFEESHQHDIRENQHSYHVAWQAARQHSVTQLAALTTALKSMEQTVEEFDKLTCQQGKHISALTEEIERLNNWQENFANEAQRREVALTEKLAAAEAREAKLRDALDALASYADPRNHQSFCECDPSVGYRCQACQPADETLVNANAILAMPSDRTALDQMLAEARREERESMQSFQARVQGWMQTCFGSEISRDLVERGDRLLEEVLELLQSGGYDPARVLALRDYVWARPVGEPSQEAGGVMVTLAAYCEPHGLNMHDAGEAELARILSPEVVEKIRAKQATKPTGSALPIALPDTPNTAGAETGKAK